MYFWGYGDVDQIKGLDDEQFIAIFDDFEKFDEASAVKCPKSIQDKIKALPGWNPYNSIIEINK